MEKTIVNDILGMGDHRNDHHLVKDIKKREGNVKIQILSIRPSKYTRTKMSGILDITSVQITPLNSDYIRENVTLQNILGRPQVVNRGSDEILTIDFAGVVSNSKIKKIACYIAKHEMYLINIDGYRDIVVRNKDGGFTSILKNGKEDCMEYGPQAVYSNATANGLTPGTMIFGGPRGGSIYSSSQGRKSQITYYNVTTEEDARKFYDRLDIANVGEWSKRYGYETDAKGVADAITRLSSKTTAMSLNQFQGCEVPNYVILFDKEDESDGCSLMNKNCVARNFMHIAGIEQTPENIEFYGNLFEGYLFQVRPYTVKASSNIEDEKFIRRKLERYNLLEVKVSEITEELEAQIDERILNKGKKCGNSLDEYDGVHIMHNDPEDEIDFVGNMNAFKDIFDYKKVDGINLLAVAHEPDDWINARTSAQLMKIVIRAINDSTVPGIKERYQEVMESMVKRSLENDADFEMENARNFKFEEIKVEYIAGLVKQLNPESMKRHPALFKAAVADLARTMANRIMIDRYDQFGHSGMICVDRAFELIMKSVLYVTKDYIDVYDPSANRYFKEMGIAPIDGVYRGVGQKYPSMGTLETSKLRFVTDEELAKRINALEISEDDKKLIAISYARLREGAVCIPSDLDSVAKILAGSDEDGDKFVIFFQNPENMPGIVELIWESGMVPRAVHIVSGGIANNTEMKVGPSSFVDIFAKNAMKDNKKVGPITNAFRILMEGRIRGENPESEVKDYFIEMFKEIFHAGTEGGGVYVSQMTKELNDCGYWEYETCGEFYDMVMSAVRHMAPTWENILLALEDFDVLGRHTQELTIDAQKKFYDVICDFIDDLRRQFSILPLKYGVSLETDWNVEEDEFKLKDDFIMAENILEQQVRIGDSVYTTKILPDAFAPVRRYAINSALEILNDYKREYFRIIHDGKQEEKRNQEYVEALTAISHDTQARLDHVIGLARTVNRMYREKSAAMNKYYLNSEATEDMTREDIVKAEIAIRYHLHEEYDELMSLVNNEIRKISNGIDSDTLVAYLAASTIVGNAPGIGLTRMLKEETTKYLANRSEIKNAMEEVRLGPGATEEDLDRVRNEFQVKVEDHTIFIDGEGLGYLSISHRIADGTYRVENVGDKVYLTCPISEFIQIPEADHSTLAFSINVFGGNDGILNFQELPLGTRVRFEERMIQGEKTTFKRIYAVDEDDNDIAEVFCGTRGKDKRLMYHKTARIYESLEGDFAGIFVSEDGVNSIVKLINVKKQGAENISIENHSNDVIEVMATFNEEEVDMSFFA